MITLLRAQYVAQSTVKAEAAWLALTKRDSYITSQDITLQTITPEKHWRVVATSLTADGATIITSVRIVYSGTSYTLEGKEGYIS